jgi:hypothetical protein
VNRLKIKVVMVAAVLGVSLAPQLCEAAEHDLRTGSFEGNWCGMAARFDITNKIGSSWRFEGKILIIPTGQYDRITIEQFADNSLEIRRSLSGQFAGKIQTLHTERPETLLKNGRFQVNFRVHHGTGFRVKNLGHLLMPKR